MRVHRKRQTFHRCLTLKLKLGLNLFSSTTTISEPSINEMNQRIPSEVMIHFRLLGFKPNVVFDVLLSSSPLCFFNGVEPNVEFIFNACVN